MLARDFTVAIELHFAARDQFGRRIDPEIRRPGVEREDEARPSHVGHIADAAEIVDGDVLALAGKNVTMEDGGEGRAQEGMQGL